MTRAILLPALVLAIAVPALAQSSSPATCAAQSVDLVFVLDGSASIRPTDYKSGLQTLANFVDTLSVGPNPSQSRIGLVVFSTNPQIVFGLDWFNTSTDIKNAILNAPQPQQDTNIAAAMSFARTEVFDAVSGVGRNRAMMVITDGQDSSDVYGESLNAHSDSITVFAVGIGPSVNVNELNIIAGSPSRVSTLTNWNDLVTVWANQCNILQATGTPEFDVTTVATTSGRPSTASPSTAAATTAAPATTSTASTLSAQTTPAIGSTPGNGPTGASGTAPSCPCQIGSVWLDIVFVIDVTAGVDRSGVQSIENTVDTALLQLTVAQSGPYSSRVAIITAGDNATVLANLTVYGDNMSAVRAINQVLRTASTQSAAPNIADGLDAARKLLDASDRYSAGYGQVVVVMSSKQSECSGDHRSEPECVNAAGIMSDPQRALVTISLKPARASDLPRVDLGNPACTIFNGSDATLPDLIAQAFCNANCFCPFQDYKQVLYINGSTCASYATCVFQSSSTASAIAAPLACTGSLVQIQDQYVQAFLNDFDSPANQAQQQYYPYWFGLSGVPPNFVWADGTPLGSNDYSNWQVVPTPGGAKQCAYAKPFGLSNTPKWFAGNCSASAPYYYTICQLPSCSSTDNSCLTTTARLKEERRQKTAL